MVWSRRGSPQLVELRREIGELRQVRVEIDHFIERRCGDLQPPLRDRLARGIDAPVDAAASRALLESGVACRQRGPGGIARGDLRRCR